MKKHDLFGHEIGLNFEGFSTHNTALGGCCSILIKISIFVYVVLNIKKLVLSEDDNIITQIYYEELADKPPVEINSVETLIFWSLTHSKAGDFKVISLNDEEV